MTILRGYPSTMPSATLDFAGSKKLDPRIAFSRASAASPDSSAMVDGKVQTFGIDVPRLGDNGLLIEEARTNYQFNSEAFAVDTGWQIKNDYTRGINTTEPAPDGSNTACQFFEVTGGGILNGVESASQYQVTAASGRLTISVYNKPINCDTFNIMPSTSTSAVANCTSIVNNTWQFNTNFVESAKAEPIGNGWYRMSATMIVPTSAQWYRPLFSSQMFAGPTDTPDSSQGCTLWGAQVEEGTFVTSYISNTGTSGQVTRAADLAEMPAAYNVNQYTIINKDFGVAGGSDTLTIVGNGEAAKRTAVYNGYLTQEQTNALAGVDEWWEWRVLGTVFGLNAMATDGVVEVDWGDGSPIENTFNGISHTFTNGSGYRTIKFRMVSGTYFAPKIGNKADYRDAFISTGPVPEGMKINFPTFAKSCTNFTTLDPTIKVQPSSFSEAFQSSGLLSFPFMDTAGVTNFTRAFHACNKLTSFPVIDTSSVTLFESSWFGCTDLTSFPLIDTSSGTNFRSTWYSCTSLTSFPLIDTSSGTDFYRAWRGCNALTSFPLIDTSSATSFYESWYSCTGLTSFPLVVSSSVTEFSFAWRSCTSLTSFPALNTSSGTTFRETWAYCSGLTSFPVIDVSSAANTFDFYMTWRGCSSLTAFPALDFTTGQTFYFCWQGCNSMVTFPAGCFDNWSPTTVRDYCFNEAWGACSSLSATSVENILNSIDTSGVSAPSTGPDITIDYDTSTGTPSVTTAVTNLKNRNWTITLNGVAQ